LVAFFLLTFLVSWTCFFGSAAARTAAASPATGVAGAIYLVGVFAPAIVALALTARASGRAGTFALVRRMVRLPSGARWYLFALGYMAGIKLAAALVYRVVVGASPPFGEAPWYLLVLAIPFSTPVQSGEELGWRGYALPRLAARFGLARASLGLGAVWGLWHLPFFFIAGVDKTGQSLPVYLLGTTALSVAMAWLYWRTGGSLFVTMLMHAAVNNTTEIVPTAMAGATRPFSLNASLVAWLALGIMWIVAAWCLWRMRGATRSEWESVLDEETLGERFGVNTPENRQRVQDAVGSG
jgi:membrane protease YdiL (CAAX protease family)